MDELIEAYLATDYCVAAEPDFVLRIGQASAPLAKLYAEQGVCCAAFVTAWNPLGVAFSEEANRAAQDRLVRLVEGKGFSWLPGRGEGTIGDWPPEDSLLILGCERPEAEEIGITFRQNAIVWVRPDSVPELVMLPQEQSNEAKNHPAIDSGEGGGPRWMMIPTEKRPRRTGSLRGPGGS